MSKDKQKAVNIALLYGKPGNAKNLGYTEGQQWIATQVIVWELLCGCRETGVGFKCTNTKFIDALTAGDHNPGVKAVYNTIATAMANHHTVPSFAANLASKAPTHTMQYKDGKYTVTLTDNNSVLNKFNYKTSGNIAVSISGNSMTLATNSPITEEKTFKRKVKGFGKPAHFIRHALNIGDKLRGRIVLVVNDVHFQIVADFFNRVF